MNCRTLEYIVALRETGSIRDAAERCSVTAGTLSGQISRAENYLGVKIFDSRSSPARLNPEAAGVYDLIHATVQNLNNIKKMSREVGRS